MVIGFGLVVVALLLATNSCVFLTNLWVFFANLIPPFIVLLAPLPDFLALLRISPLVATLNCWCRVGPPANLAPMPPVCPVNSLDPFAFGCVENLWPKFDGREKAFSGWNFFCAIRNSS